MLLEMLPHKFQHFGEESSFACLAAFWHFGTGSHNWGLDFSEKFGQVFEHERFCLSAHTSQS